MAGDDRKIDISKREVSFEKKDKTPEEERQTLQGVVEETKETVGDLGKLEEETKKGMDFYTQLVYGIPILQPVSGMYEIEENKKIASMSKEEQLKIWKISIDRLKGMYNDGQIGYVSAITGPTPEEDIKIEDNSEGSFFPTVGDLMNQGKKISGIRIHRA